jgi:hypothetical protein
VLIVAVVVLLTPGTQTSLLDRYMITVARDCRTPSSAICFTTLLQAGCCTCSMGTDVDVARSNVAGCCNACHA